MRVHNPFFILLLNFTTMTKYILAVIAAALIFSCSPKMAATGTEITDASGNKMLLGVCSKEVLAQQPYNEWFTKNTNGYAVDENTAGLLKEKLKDKTFTIFLGTWCGDSKREIPRMLKVLQYCGVKESRIKLVMVSNSDSAYKQSPTHEERGLNIHHVPTMIVYSKGIETGRMIESPVVSWEKDLLAICSNENYKPKYAGVEYLEQQFAALGMEGVERDSTAIAAQLKQLLKTEYDVSAYAKAKRTTGEIKKAILVARLNAAVFADKADAWYILGANYQAAGDIAAAKENYGKVLMLKTDHENARKKLEELDKQ
jgi:tetratricopeptide (TPR) repeat protein